MAPGLTYCMLCGHLVQTGGRSVSDVDGPPALRPGALPLSTP